MVKVGNLKCLIWVSSVLCGLCVSFGYNPLDNYLIDCGSSANQSIGSREFAADDLYANLLFTPQNVSAESSSNSISSNYGPVLYRTARIFTGTSRYTFAVRKTGRHWIRIHFFPFVYSKYNMSTARFSVSAQNFTLLKEYQLDSGSEMKEFSIDVDSNQLVLTFSPLADSFAFVNALEVFSLPEELIPESVRSVGPQGGNQSLSQKALETVQRVNMGNETVVPRNDTLWRFWSSGDAYIRHNNLVVFVRDVDVVNFTGAKSTENIAPATVYGTATRLNSINDPNTNANITWTFDVDPGFEYLVRFHFCDILRNPHSRLVFNVYVGSSLVYENLDLLNATGSLQRAPYFLDVVAGVSGSRLLNVSVGTAASVVGSYPDAILNGLEIMKISNSKNSLDILDVIPPLNSKKNKIFIIVGVVVGLFIVVVSALVLILLCRSRKKRAKAGHSTVENGFHASEGGNLYSLGSKYSNGVPIFSTSKFGYRLPFVAVQEATDNFNESLVLGVGGFGKVYKGVLRDETPVAVKRGTSLSQGISEFRTEIEMLSQFRHRHLVSLIGYCDEKNEMIVIYEYMENGTLKDHLYSSDRPRLSWKQRLEICIGAAKGLHYLHTGSTKAIIHRDVKSANILLDENFMAKVADFGLSKTGPEIDQSHVSTAVKGSFGYLDPEYLVRQQLTEKSDVYSFGVVMFEVLSGRPVIDPSLPREKVNLIEWTLKSLKKGKSEEIADPLLEGQIKPESLHKFVEIAEKCLAEFGADRPSMGDVLWNLELALQLQTNEDRANQKKELNPQPSSASSLKPSLSTQISHGSLDDLHGISMSKVFAQMVREDMR